MSPAAPGSTIPQYAVTSPRTKRCCCSWLPKGGCGGRTRCLRTCDPLFCDLLANLHLHLEHEVEIDRVLEVKRISTAAVVSLADTIEHALPGLGRAGAFDVLLAAYSLAAPLWQIANPPKKLADAYAEGTDVPPDWNIDFTSALTRLITATCVGLMTEPAEPDHG
jgi:hypothetical protein